MAWHETMRFTVDGVPGPQGSKRHVGGGRMIESSKKVRPWRKAVVDAARQQLTQLHPIPKGKPVYVDIAFVFHRPKSTPQRVAMPVTRTSGDIDKLCRSTLDALVTAGVMHDDSQVASLRSDKLWGDLEGASVIVYEWV